MPLPNEIQDIVTAMSQAEGNDFVAITSESSMLHPNLEKQIIANYNNVLWPHYKELFEKLGGTDKILEDLEEHIVKKIDQYHAEKDNSRDNNSANTSGTNARKEFNFRKEFKGELGEYHSALRVLLDSGNLLTLHNLAFGISQTWPNLLHKGSNVKYQGIPLRTLLAVYWLAAKDSDMQIAEAFQEELATPGKREEFLKSSMNIFISLLAEIRRAHNEDQYKESTLDSPSCAPGTFGRMTARSSIYNKLTALPATPYARIPKEIENFIIKKLKEEAPEVRIAVFNTINNTLAYNDVNEQEREICNKYIKSLSDTADPAIFEELLAYLTKEINSHQNQKHINLRLPQVQESIRKLVAIIQRDLDMENPNSRPDTNFIIRILEVGLVTLGDSKLQTAIDEPLVEFRLSLRQLDHEISVLERLINNELIRGLLAPAYFTTPKAKEKLNWLLETVVQNIDILFLIRSSFDELVKNKANEIVQQLQDETECNHEINAENLSPFKLPKSTAERFDKLVVKVDKLGDKIDYAVAKRTEYIKTLPVLPGHQANYANSKPEQWAANILRVASEKESNGDLVRDMREIERNIELMQANLTSTSIHQVLQLINAKLKQPEIISAKDKTAIKQLINDKLKEKQLDLDSQVAQIAPDTISISSIILDAEPDGIYDSKIAEINFCLTKDFDEIAFKKWQTAIAALLDNDVHANIKKLQTAVLLTLFVNLEISEMNQGDVQTILNICEYYIGTKDASKVDLLGGPINPHSPLPIKIHRLANHLACLITNLKAVSLLFQAGWIRLLSKDEAETQVKLAQARGLDKPFIIRVSNTNPALLALTALNLEKGTVKHSYCNHEQFIQFAAFFKSPSFTVKQSQRISSSKIYHYTFGLREFNLEVMTKNLIVRGDSFYGIATHNFYLFTTDFLCYLLSCDHPDYPFKTPAAGCNITLQEITSEEYQTQSASQFKSKYRTNYVTQTPRIIETTQKLEKSLYKTLVQVNNINNNNAVSNFTAIPPTSNVQETTSNPQISPQRNDLAPRTAPTANGNSMAQLTPSSPAAILHTVAPSPVTVIPQAQSNSTLTSSQASNSTSSIQATPTPAIRETTQNIENNEFQRARATSHMVNSLLNLSWSDDSTLNLDNSPSPLTTSPMTNAAFRFTPAAQPVSSLTPTQANNTAQSTLPIATTAADAISIISSARLNTAAVANNINLPTSPAIPLSTTQNPVGVTSPVQPVRSQAATQANQTTTQSINNNNQAQSSFFFSTEKPYMKSMKNVTSQQKDTALKALEEDLNNLGTMSVMHDVHSIFSAISLDTNILRQYRENYIYSSGNMDSYKKAIQLIINKIVSIRISFQEYSSILEILKAAIQCKLVENDIIDTYKQAALVQLQDELAAQQDLRGINILFLQVTEQQHFLRYEQRSILFSYGDTDSYAAAILAIARRASTVQLLRTENEGHMFDNIMSKFDACFDKHLNEQEWLTAHQNLHEAYANNFSQQALRI